MPETLHRDTDNIPIMPTNYPMCAATRKANRGFIATVNTTAITGEIHRKELHPVVFHKTRAGAEAAAEAWLTDRENRQKLWDEAHIASAALRAKRATRRRLQEPARQ